ncbi:MAG: hypothetical protein CL902_09730 [Dehalococcoidia bacterium]|nr:hypothetical protein [Dehalococcoidia bacterium]
MGILLRPYTIIVALLVALGLAIIFVPAIGQFTLRFGGETVTIEDPSSQRAADSDGTRDLRIINILGRDGIPAILQPEFGFQAAARDEMDPSERVIGLSINGDSRAYPLKLLSRHEIVNDTVGGKPVAVTW